MKTGLPPVVDDRATILVLGSLPGDQSIAKGQYYGNPRNHFWEIMAAVLGKPLPEGYDQRIEMLQQQGIALWDVLHSAERKGSLDSNIKGEAVNDLCGLLQCHPGIRLVVLNGSKAAQCYHRYFSQLTVPCVELRSSSPVPSQRCNTLQEKIAHWQEKLHAAGD